MCWDESWEDQWLTWWELSAIPAAPKITVDRVSESEAAIREAAELTRPRQRPTAARFIPALGTVLRRFGRRSELESREELALTGRR